MWTTKSTSDSYDGFGTPWPQFKRPAAPRPNRSTRRKTKKRSDPKIRRAGGKVILPPLYSKQRAAMFHPARVVTIEGSTKSGKTLGLLVWQGHEVLTDALAREHWWVAHVYATAEIAYRRAKRMYRGGYRSNDSTRTLTFHNGARWVFRSGEKPDNLYGEDVASAVIDEASRFRVEAWYAIRSTLTATRGRVRLIANVKGRGNWHYALCRKAESGEIEGYHYAKLTAVDAVEGGVLSQRDLDEAREDYPDDVYKQLFECIPLEDGGNPFGIDSIAKCTAPMSSGKPYIWGIDVAKKRDWTVCIALDKAGKTCAIERFQGKWDDQIDRICELVGKRSRVIMDDTGVGDVVADVLRRLGTRVEGYLFTPKSKQYLMEGLQVDIQRGRAHVVDGVLKRELDVFEYALGRGDNERGFVKYSAPPGLHDDAVCAFALVQHLGRQLHLGDRRTKSAIADLDTHSSSARALDRW